MSSLYIRQKRIYLDFTDQWNIRRQRALKLKLTPDGKIPEEAKQIQKKVDSDIALGRFDTLPKTPVIPISRMRDEYLSFIGNTRDPKTKYLYKLAITELIRFTKDVPIISVTQETIIDFRTKLLKKSEAHASRTLRSLSPIFRFAAEERHWIPFSPITRYSAVKVRKKHIDAFTEPEIQSLFAWAKKLHGHFYDQIYFLYLTGFRSNESCSAEWSHIDLKRRVIIHYDDKLDEWIPYPLDRRLINFFKTIERRKDGYIFHSQRIGTVCPKRVAIRHLQSSTCRSQRPLRTHSPKIF